MNLRFFAVFAAFCLFALGARAQQETVFIQLEARTSLAGAEASVRRYAGRLDDVAGFSIGGGWYGIALGPYSRAEAEALLPQLRARGVVPVDSYIEDSIAYGRQFWPVGARVIPANPEVTEGVGDTAALDTSVDPEPVAAPEPEPVPAQVVEPVPEPVAEPEPEPEETVREARASEATLTRAEREELQIALKWGGYYQYGIDGAFGRGTRSSMAAWQAENGFDTTGVLTTRQRAVLLGQYYAVLEGMDMARLTDNRAGISMEMPLGVVRFDRYEAPFALFSPKGDLDVRVLLISQPGDRQTMNGLYEIMQTLEIVPLEGERQRDRDSFLLTGANDRIVSHTEVTQRDGAIKGFTLIWPAGDEERRTRVLGLMQKSFERIDGVLDPAAVSDDGQQVDLVSGLKVRTPLLTASGFFVDMAGTALTSHAAVQGCSRVTLDGVHEARVAVSDEALGIAVLKPVDRLAPRRAAQFRADTPRLQSEVAVAGFPFGGVLAAPTLTFGTLEDVRGLSGEENLKRLALNSLPGDAGGPVFDTGGTVLGMLLPREDSAGRRLPEEVSFAVNGTEILGLLRAQGVQPVARGGAGIMAPEDLTALAADMTVLVSCWE